MKKRITTIIVAVTMLAAVTVGTIKTIADNHPAAIHFSYENTGDMCFDIIQYALSQVGYHEGTDNWNAYGNSFGHSSGAWCAYFVQWCARQADVSESIIPASRFGRVSDYWESADADLEFHPVNDYSNPYTPKAGDLVIYRNVRTFYDRATGKINTYATPNSIECQFGLAGNSNGSTSRISHIGIVTRDATYPTNTGSQINNAGFCMVDGNWRDSVVSRFELYENVTGFVSIKYVQDNPVQSISTGKWPVLKSGSIGEEVSVLQAMLNATIGAGLDVDGNFGAETAIAVIRYQTWSGLTVDGQVGPNTWQSLTSKVLQTQNNYNWGLTRQIQKLLNDRFGIETSVDGNFGPKTTASVKKLQLLAGITADGKVGPATWRLLICGLMV